MAEKSLNARCSICGRGYRLCRSCLNKDSLKSWRSVTDTMEHYKIYLAIHGYTLSKNKAAAKDELCRCDLSGLPAFKPENRAAIEEIMS